MAEKLYRKRIILPLAILQILALCVFVAESAVALYIIKKDQDSGDFSDLPEGVSAHDVKIGGAVNLGIAGFTLILTFVELVLFAMHKLKPVLFVISTTLKTILWSAFLGLTIASLSNNNWLGILLCLVICVTSLFQLCYSSRIYRALRKGTLETVVKATASSIANDIEQQQDDETKHQRDFRHKREQEHNQMPAEVHHPHHQANAGHACQGSLGWAGADMGSFGSQNHHHGGGHGGHHN